MRTTEGAGKPDRDKSSIFTSSGHGAFFALVIIAITLWPATLLNDFAVESTSAGRRFS